jgi:hypothetical protein
MDAGASSERKDTGAREGRRYVRRIARSLSRTDGLGGPCKNVAYIAASRRRLSTSARPVAIIARPVNDNGTASDPVAGRLSRWAAATVVEDFVIASPSTLTDDVGIVALPFAIVEVAVLEVVVVVLDGIVVDPVVVGVLGVDWQSAFQIACPSLQFLPAYCFPGP